MTRDEFEALIQRVADAWAALDAESAGACFTDDAVYMQPPDEQLFVGRDELLAYFAPLEPGTYLRLDNLWFDEGRQRGTVEFTFGVGDQDTVDHGTSVVDVADGRIRPGASTSSRGRQTWSVSSPPMARLGAGTSATSRMSPDVHIPIAAMIVSS